MIIINSRFSLIFFLNTIMEFHWSCTLFGISDDSDDEVDQEEIDPHAGRFVRYQFTPQFLKLKTVGATYVWWRNNYATWMRKKLHVLWLYICCDVYDYDFVSRYNTSLVLCYYTMDQILGYLVFGPSICKCDWYSYRILTLSTAHISVRFSGPFV